MQWAPTGPLSLVYALEALEVSQELGYEDVEDGGIPLHPLAMSPCQMTASARKPPPVRNPSSPTGAGEPEPLL